MENELSDRIDRKMAVYLKVLKDFSVVVRDEIERKQDDKFSPSSFLRSMAYELVRASTEVDTLLDFYDKINRTKMTELEKLKIEISNSFYLGTSREVQALRLHNHHEFNGTLEQANDEINVICYKIHLYCNDDAKGFDWLISKIESASTRIKPELFYIKRSTSGFDTLYILKADWIVLILKELKIPFLDEDSEFGSLRTKVLTIQINP